MSKYYKKEEYVYRDLEITMSKDCMANVLYAGIQTDARFTTLWDMNRGEYTRQQNCRFKAHIKVHIHPEQIELFKELSNLELKKPASITIN
jgi:hypothetical protein